MTGWRSVPASSSIVSFFESDFGPEQDDDRPHSRHRPDPAGVPRRRALGTAAARGATGSTSAAPRGRWRSRSATMTCRNCWRACWPGAGRGRRGRRLPRSDHARADAGSRHRSPACAAAAERIADARHARARTVAIFGDYDVDGATSAAVLARYPAPLRRSIRSIHIPDRMFEGYGPNVEAVRALAGRGRDAAGHGRLRHHQPSSRWPKRASSASTSS